jgi:hypothetical protein
MVKGSEFPSKFPLHMVHSVVLNPKTEALKKTGQDNPLYSEEEIQANHTYKVWVFKKSRVVVPTKLQRIGCGAPHHSVHPGEEEATIAQHFYWACVVVLDAEMRHLPTY